MSHAATFIDEIKKRGFDFYTGVPCSLLKGIYPILENEPTDRYVSAVREDSAFGIAAGAYLGGRKPALFIQNSGLGVSVNALSSLLILYKMPCLIVASWRGYMGKDAPEHLLTGATTPQLLDLMKIPHEVLDPDKLDEQMTRVCDHIDSERTPAAFLVRPGILE